MPVGNELAKVVPLALAAAVNPAGIMVLIAVLASAKRTAAAVATGFCVVFIAFGLAVLALGLNVSGRHGAVSAAIDIAAAAAVAYLGARTLRKQRAATKDPKVKTPAKPKRRLGLAGGFAAGLALAASDVTSLIPYGIALKDLSISGLSATDVAAADAVFLVICLSPMVLPVALTYATPGAAGKVLDPVHRVLTRHGDTIMGVVCLVLAAYLAEKGVRGL